MSSKIGKYTYKNKCRYPVVKRTAPSPILQVSQANSTSFDTTANTIKPLEIFTSMTRKRKCYAFQLLKQFILFSDSQSETQSDHFHTSIPKSKHFLNPQKAELHLCSMFSIIKRFNQKLLLSAYSQLKKRFLTKKMVYRNKQYITKIVDRINNLLKNQHHKIMQYVFVELFNNMKTLRMKEGIEQKGFQEISVPEQFQYEDKIFKTRQYMPFYSDQQSGIMKNDTQSFFESDSRIRIAKDFGIRKFKNSLIQQTPIKQPNYDQHLPTTRHRTKSTLKQFTKQLIYIVGSGRKYSLNKDDNKSEPNKHIKIPIETSYIDIIRIQRQQQQRRRRRKSYGGRKDEYFQKVSERFFEDCSKCQYCVKIKLNQEVVNKLKLRK